MAIITVTSTADSGAGTLRQAIADAQSGDTIVFDSSLEEDGVITILLSSKISLPTKDLTIDGGSHTGSGATLTTRVVLDAQQLDRILQGSVFSSSYTLVFNDCTFKNGYISSSNGGGAYITTLNSTNFNYCVFDTCEAQNGGGVYALSSASCTFENCLFKNNTATTNGGGFYATNTAQSVLNNCVFYSCSAINGGGLYTYLTSQTTLNSCILDNCSCSANGNAVAVYGTSQITLNNCSFTPPNNTRATVYNIGTNENDSLIFQGVNNINRVFLSTNATMKNTGKTTVDYLSFLNSGASVTFSGVDSILAVTTTASVGSATFTAAEGSTGYAAFPDNTDISAATFAGVKTATYGATTAVSATVDKRTVSVTITPSSSQLVEYKSVGGSTWNTLELTNGSGTIADDRAFKVRTFDGSFVESTTVPRTYYYQGSASSGSFQTPADWAMDSAKTLTCNATPTIAGCTFRL